MENYEKTPKHLPLNSEVVAYLQGWETHFIEFLCSACFSVIPTLHTINYLDQVC